MATRKDVEKAVAKVPDADGFILYEQGDGEMKLLAEREPAATGGGVSLIILDLNEEPVPVAG